MRTSFFHGRTSTALLSAVLAFATLAVFAQTAGFGFVSIDDPSLVVQNPLIRDISSTTLSRVLTSYDPELYVPLTMLSYHTDFFLGALRPSFYHVHNVLLHLLSTLLVFAIFLRLRLHQTFAFFGALLFAIHPINTEAVAWISARKDLLSTFYGLLSVLSFLQYQSSRDRRWFALALLAFAFGLLSKVTILLLPSLFFVLMAPEQSRRSRLRTLSPFIVLSVIFAVVALIGKARTLGASIPVIAYPLLSAKALYLTLLHLFVPIHLSPLYPQLTAVSVLSPDVIVSMAVTFVVLALAWTTLRRRPVMRIGVMLFFIGLIPSFLTFTKNGEVYVTSDRYAYMASIGFFLITVALLQSLWGFLQQRSRPLASALLVIFGCGCAVLGVLAFDQARLWKSNESFLRSIIEESPSHALAYNNLGAERKSQGKMLEAEEAYRTAISLDPHFILPHINLASMYREQKKDREAEAEYHLAIQAIDRTKRIQSDDLIGFYLLGTMLLDRGDIAGGLSLFKEAVVLGSDIAEAQLNLALTLHRLNKFTDAEMAYRRAIALNPTLTTAHYNLAEIFAGRGRLPEALSELDAVLRLDPSNAQARVHRERIQEMIGG